MNKILVTGGAGFIGSHVVDFLLKEYKNSEIIILDKITYAADIRNLPDLKINTNVSLMKGDICDFKLCIESTKNVDLVINLAAESHVDKSFHSSLQFTHSNTLGTHTLLEACRVNMVPKVIHVSTDEIYGEILNGKFNEESPFNPSNPYAASKAGAEQIVNSYFLSYGLPIVRIRANNIFGIRQFPEKIIPKFILYLLLNKKLPIHGDGKNIRTYLYVRDFISALEIIINKGLCGAVYNVGALEEYSNLEIAEILCMKFGRSLNESIIFIANRPFNDARYSITFDKMSKLGWQPNKTVVSVIDSIIEWYRSNLHRYEFLFENECMESQNFV